MHCEPLKARSPWHESRETTKTHSSTSLACCFTPLIQQHHLSGRKKCWKELQPGTAACHLLSLPLVGVPMQIPPPEKKNMPKLTVGHAFLAAISSGLNVVVLVGPLPVITIPSVIHFAGIPPAHQQKRLQVSWIVKISIYIYSFFFHEACSVLLRLSHAWGVWLHLIFWKHY